MREFDILQHVFRANAALSTRVTIPPGDDMGAVRIGGIEVLATVDQVADGVHFDLRTTSLERIGQKAITRNLSDVAAMAAAPVGALVAACLPRDFGQENAQALFDRMRAVAESYQCPLFGGDIAIWDHPLLLSVTVLAEPAGIAPLQRRGAKAGDVICVTGELGGSLEEIDGYIHHLDFQPRLSLARQLAGNPRWRPHCMIDLSDGLARDLGHLCRAAGLAAEIDANQLPLSPGTWAAANRDRKPLWEHAVGDGEDYELCFTLSPEAAAHLPEQIEGVPITRIGRMTAPATEPTITVNLPAGQKQTLTGMGWEHQGP